MSETIMQNLQRLEYDKEFKWLKCGMCHEKTPTERYIVHTQTCVVCANKENREYEQFKDKFEKEEEQKFMDTMRQGDNFEDSNV